MSKDTPLPYKGGFLTRQLYVSICVANGVARRQANDNWVDTQEDLFMGKMTPKQAGTYLGSMLEIISGETFDALWRVANRNNLNGEF